ncbi:MAG TPA: hypothetical protein VKB79_07270 [Bryobacteraceae bacterium]|nr:hypothetical protein [Bryobacteraceae bacterium]
MDLATHQRKLLGLFRATYQATPEDGPYLNRVAASRDLEEGRRNIFLWRLWVLERTSVLTFRILLRRRLLEDAVNRFISQRNISPFRETQAPDFLRAMSDHEDQSVAAVARFELALEQVRGGDEASYAIPFPTDPVALLHALALDRDVPAELAHEPAQNHYEIIVSRNLPGHFEVRDLA